MNFEEFKAEIEQVFGHVPFSSHQNPGEDYIYRAIDTYTRNTGPHRLIVKWSEGNFGHWRVAFGPVECFGTSLRICAEEVRETLEQDARTLRLYLDALPQRADATPTRPVWLTPPTIETEHAAEWACVRGSVKAENVGDVGMWRVVTLIPKFSWRAETMPAALVAGYVEEKMLDFGGLATADPAPTLESRVAALEAKMAAMATALTIQPDLTVEPEWHEAPLVNGVLRDWVRNRVRAYKPEGGWMVILMDKDQFAVRTWEDLTPANAALVVRVLCGVLP